MNPYEQWLQQLLGNAQPPAPRDVLQPPQMNAPSNPNPQIYQLFNMMPEISRVLSGGAGYTVAQDPYGNMFRQEGPIPWRNNNPGNLKYMPGKNNRGAVGESAGFSVYPTQQAGIDAALDNLFGPKSTYKNKTPRQIVETYAPEKDGNDVKAYTKFLISRIGADIPLSKMNAVQKQSLFEAILQMEGFNKGGVVSMDGKTWTPPKKQRSKP